MEILNKFKVWDKNYPNAYYKFSYDSVTKIFTNKIDLYRYIKSNNIKLKDL